MSAYTALQSPQHWLILPNYGGMIAIFKHLMWQASRRTFMAFQSDLTTACVCMYVQSPATTIYRNNRSSMDNPKNHNSLNSLSKTAAHRHYLPHSHWCYIVRLPVIRFNTLFATISNWVHGLSTIRSLVRVFCPHPHIAHCTPEILSIGDDVKECEQYYV